jgi:hypothetical protein
LARVESYFVFVNRDIFASQKGFFAIFKSGRGRDQLLKRSLASFAIFSRPQPLLRTLSEQIVIPSASQYPLFGVGVFEVFGEYA